MGARRFDDDARRLAHDGFDGCETISKLGEQTRIRIRADLRKNAATTTQRILINEIFNRYENDKPTNDSSGENQESAKLEELSIPTQMRHRPADLGGVDSFIKPGQESANLFTKEFAISSMKNRPYIPSSRPNCAKSHGAPPPNLKRTLVQSVARKRPEQIEQFAS